MSNNTNNSNSPVVAKVPLVPKGNSEKVKDSVAPTVGIPKADVVKAPAPKVKQHGE